MKVGDTVLVVAEWSSFHGMRGRVVQVDPYLAIAVGGDPRPIRVGEREVVRCALPEQHHAGAE